METTITHVKEWSCNNGVLRVTHGLDVEKDDIGQGRPQEGGCFKNVAFVPKNGDFCADMAGNLLIFKNWYSQGTANTYAGYISAHKELYINCDRFTGGSYRPQTAEEEALLLSTLRSIGKKWNAEKKVVEDIGLERVSQCGTYYIIDAQGFVIRVSDCRDEIDNIRFKLGNYFHSQSEAEEFFEKEIKPIYQKRHNK